MGHRAVHPVSGQPGEASGCRLIDFGLSFGTVRDAVGQQNHSVQVAVASQHTQFVAAAVVFGVKPAQVHENDVGTRHQDVESDLPGAVEAITLVDPVAPVRIGQPVESIEALV